MQTLQKLSERIFYLPPVAEPDRPILAAIRGNDETLLIDAGNSTNHAKLFKEQLATMKIAGDLIALTHSHWDHVFGLYEMQLASISNSITSGKIKDMQFLSWQDEALDSRVTNGTETAFSRDAMKIELGDDRNITIIEPTIVFDKEITVDLGGITCLLEHVQADHSTDSTLIFVREEKTLFLGDCLYANMEGEKWYYTAEKMLPLLDKIESYGAEKFVLSHHPAPLSKEEFTNFSTLLRQCAKLTAEHRENTDKLLAALETRLDRELTETDLEVVNYFVHG